MTNQELFDKMATHLLTQGEKSVDESRNKCLYRGPNGLKCAAGVLISDEAYSESLEGEIVSDPNVQFALKTSGVEDCQMYLVEELQLVHDTHWAESWAVALSSVAQKFHLKFEIPTT
jgi:hypothetical protein